jgi:uncharacterized membrane protein
MVSALCSIAAIPLFYALARRLFDSVSAANVAAVLLATSPFQIAYAQEVRMYALLALCQLGAFYFFHRAWTDDKWQDWLAFGLLEVLAFYSHSLAALNLLALDVFALWRWRELRARWRGLTAAHVVIVLLFAPWMFVLVQQISRVLRGFRDAPSTLLDLLRTPYVLNFNSALPTSLVLLALMVTLLLFFFGIYRTVRALIRESIPPRDRQALQLALAITIVPPVALWVVFADPSDLHRARDDRFGVRSVLALGMGVDAATALAGSRRDGCWRGVARRRARQLLFRSAITKAADARGGAGARGTLAAG